MSCRLALLLFGVLLPLGTCGCRTMPVWLRRDANQLPPAAFTQTPTMEQVVDVVNSNTSRVRQLQTENATLRVEGIPALRANIAFEQPRNFRLRAELSQFTGQELDMGSNDELFWFWVRRDEQPGIYYARHNEFAASPSRDLVPIAPEQLVDALGLVHLDPEARHFGPSPKEDLFEIRSQMPTPRGDMTRVLLINAKYGWMVEQHYYDVNGQLLLSARAGQHRYYPNDAVTMPHHVEVRLLPGQPAQMAFDLDVGRYVFNRLTGERAGLWTLPEIEGYPLVDIAAPQFRPPVAALPRDPYGAPSMYGAFPRGAAPVTAPAGNYERRSVPRPGYLETRTATVPNYRGYQ